MDSYKDPVIELAGRTGTDIMDLVGDGVTDEEAAQVLEVLDELAAEEKAGDIASRLRRAGHVL
jgi:hypothetical protein